MWVGVLGVKTLYIVTAFLPHFPCIYVRLDHTFTRLAILIMLTSLIHEKWVA